MKTLKLSLAALAVAACFLPGAAGAHEGHAPSAEPRAAPAPNRWGANYFPNVELQTHDGRTVRLYDDLLKGKSVAINLMFTECKDVCPLETANMVQLQRELGDRVGKDIFFYSLSIDPKNDTPKVLKAYAEKFGAGWLFLTGRPEDVKLVASKLGLARGRDAETRDGHGSMLMVGNEPTGQWIRNSALDNPRFLATRIGSFFGWKDTRQQKSYAEARPPVFEKGQYVFQSRCSACHTLGQGDRVGPDLAGVTARRERAWLARYVEAPDRVLAAGDPVATALFKRYKEVRMPNLSLRAEEVDAVLSYIESHGPRNTAEARR